MAARPRPAIALVEAMGVWQSLQMPSGSGSCMRVRLGERRSRVRIPARSLGGLWAHSDPLLNKPFYPSGLVTGILTMQCQLARMRVVRHPRSFVWVFPVAVVNVLEAQGDEVDELLRITAAVGNTEVKDVDAVFGVRSSDLLARLVRHHEVERNVTCLGVGAEVDPTVHELRRRK
ncbi:unnamed protein product [Closterium sp. NIES-54]